MLGSFHRFLLQGTLPDPLANDLSLELGEREQDVQRQPAHRVCRVELLGYRDKGNTVFIECFHDPGEVHERAAKSIDFVDHHAIDLPAFDVFQESIESRSIEATARETTVVVLLWQAFPAFVLLAGNERLGGFALRVERVEFQLKPLFTRLAGVDRAAIGRL